MSALGRHVYGYAAPCPPDIPNALPPGNARKSSARVSETTDECLKGIGLRSRVHVGPVATTCARTRKTSARA
ncbi:MAG: hypothetical protein K2M65_06805 [Muribaculaceae bacterium]|nr:hypothetical protein [Muribaculaceae bacterium]